MSTHSHHWLIKLTRLIIAILFITALTISQPGYAQNEIEPNQVREIVWSPNGDKVAVSYQNGQITIVSVNGAEVSLSPQGRSGTIFTLAWSPNGNFLAGGSANPDNTLYIWSAVNGEQIVAQPDFGIDVSVVAWKPDGSQVIASAIEGDTIVIEPASGQLIATVETGSLSDIEWSPDGTKIAMTGTSAVYLFDAATFQSISEYPIDQQIFRQGLQNQPVRVVWSPDGTRIAVGMGDGRIFLWQLDNLEPLFSFVGHDYQGEDRFLGWIYDLRFDSSGQTLTSVSGDGEIRTWNLQDGTLVGEQRASPNYAADFSPFGARIALGLAPEAVNETALQSSAAEVVQTLADGAVQIVVLAPSLERLQAIAEACKAPTSVEQSLSANAQADPLSDFVAQVEALPADSIPPACAADLIAVAQALQSE